MLCFFATQFFRVGHNRAAIGVERPVRHGRGVVGQSERFRHRPNVPTGKSVAPESAGAVFCRGTRHAPFQGRGSGRMDQLTENRQVDQAAPSGRSHEIAHSTVQALASRAHLTGRTLKRIPQIGAWARPVSPSRAIGQGICRPTQFNSGTASRERQPASVRLQHRRARLSPDAPSRCVTGVRFDVYASSILRNRRDFNAAFGAFRGKRTKSG